MEFYIIYGLSGLATLVAIILIFTGIIDYPLPSRGLILTILLVIFCPILNTLIALYCIFCWIVYLSGGEL